MSDALSNGSRAGLDLLCRILSFMEGAVHAISKFNGGRPDDRICHQK